MQSLALVCLSSRVVYPSVVAVVRHFAPVWYFFCRRQACIHDVQLLAGLAASCGAAKLGIRSQANCDGHEP